MAIRRQYGNSGQIWTTISGGGPSWVDPLQSESLEDTLKKATFDDEKIRLHKLFGDLDNGFEDLGPPPCTHDWVTWTGLRGTQTDCTKCRAIKT